MELLKLNVMEIKKMSKENTDLKTFNMRMPRETWLFLKKQAALQEVSMTEIILRCVEKYKRKFDNKLTDEDTNV